MIQFAAAFVLLLPLAWATESMHVVWHPDFVFALVWLALVLSIGAISLLFHLIEHGEATRVASLIYLTPIFAVVLEALMFGVIPSALTLAGVAVTCAGVALVCWQPRVAGAPAR